MVSSTASASGSHTASTRRQERSDAAMINTTASAPRADCVCASPR